MRVGGNKSYKEPKLL